jgi:hypothetical protein
MGEAKRRGPRAPRDDAADRLPHFIFGRDRAAEKAGGFILAGRLLTPFPKRGKPSQAESDEIAALIQELTRMAREDPSIGEVGAWRGDIKPPGGLKPPFPKAALLARAKSCAVVVVRVDPRNDGRIRVDDITMADILGRQ